VFGNPLASENSTDPASLGYSSVSTGAENVRHRSTFQLSRQHAFVGPACFWPVQISRNWAHQVHVNLSFLPGRLPQSPFTIPHSPNPQFLPINHPHGLTASPSARKKLYWNIPSPMRPPGGATGKTAAPLSSSARGLAGVAPELRPGRGWKRRRGYGGEGLLARRRRALLEAGHYPWRGCGA
jgi:hypothetical protein